MASFLPVEGSSEGHTFFEEKVRPLLDKHCLKCHSEEKKIKGGLLLDRKSGWEKGGDSGPVIVLGKPEDSLLIAMVKHNPEVESMPPKSKLSGPEIATLEKWIKMGAPDPRAQAIGEKVLKSDFDLEERKDWWSLQPVKEYELPKVSDPSWPLNEIDRFVMAKLDEKEWKPAGETSPEVLFRRASIILTGLAPTLEELDALKKDTEPKAYERAVERLLSSPHFGEHWARQWMDLVRYGDSKGFENDYFMSVMFRYRDYLTRAFNSDLPYDQFIREAFAGDQLETPRLDPTTGNNESVIGPGFLLMSDGHHGPPDLGEDEARSIDGTINAIGSAFHGLTIHCARCHDHKFDAITDEDYYSLYGTLRSSRLHYANIAAVQNSTEEITAVTEAHKNAIKATLQNASSIPEFNRLRKIIESPETKILQEKIATLEGEEREKALQKFRTEASKTHGDLLSHWLFESLYGTTPELASLRHWIIHQSSLPNAKASPPSNKFEWADADNGFRKIDNPSFIIDPANPALITSAVGSGFIAGHISPRFSGDLRSEDFTLNGQNLTLWVKGRNATVNLRVRNYELVGHGPTTSVLRKRIDTDIWQKITFPTVLWKGETAYLEVIHDGWTKRAVGAREGLPNPSDHAYAALTESPPNWNSVWLEGNNPSAQIAKLLESDRTLSPVEAEVIAALFRTGLLKTDPNLPELATLKKARAAIAKPVYVRSLIDGNNYQQTIFIRGNHKKPSTAENPRHFLDGISGDAITQTVSGRREWAKHLLAADNPLTARVRVNQLWARVFGRGIVSSVDDFGKMGTLPSHPELLDYLAHDFASNGWSMKNSLRQMVFSQTFRMSSVPSESSRQLDPDNALLQRMPVRRLEAEGVRDHLLNCSGELKLTLFGPTIPISVKDMPASRAKPTDGPVDGYGRRSLYLTARRNFLSPFLSAFDYPVLPEPMALRPVTTVPAQSLALLNHPLVHDQAEKWAQRILKEESSTDERIQRIHRQAFSRDAAAEELTWAQDAIQTLSKDQGQNELQTWSALCHLMINRKEFLYVF
ncbi:PSD1 and planctomycete cytochrome C domain-containing protein [Akkermansiaceae bacterium]|nr:PSD1 and planctomycete cytochrome C domain-containing protein [Akkermansiaceae bacterium]